MAIRVTRRFRPFIAPALVSMALTACSSATPTAPSSQSASDAAPGAITASVSSASVTTAAQLNAANTIKINQGTLALPSGGGLAGPLTLQGSHGFRFDGRAYTAGLTPSNYCGFGSPCQPGATVAFTATWVGGDIPGTVRLQGDEFEVGNLDQPGNISPGTDRFVCRARSRRGHRVGDRTVRGRRAPHSTRAASGLSADRRRRRDVHLAMAAIHRRLGDHVLVLRLRRRSPPLTSHRTCAAVPLRAAEGTASIRKEGRSGRCRSTSWPRSGAFLTTSVMGSSDVTSSFSTRGRT